MVTICTVLPAAERPRIDAAGDGCFNTLHAESLREALYVARRRGASPTRPAEHAHVALSSRASAVAQELPRRHAPAARFLSVSESRIVGFGCRVSDGLLITAELWASLARGVGRDCWRISPPISV